MDFFEKVLDKIALVCYHVKVLCKTAKKGRF